MSCAKFCSAARSSAEPDSRALRLFKASRAACSGVDVRRKTPSRKYRNCCSVASEAPPYLSACLIEEILKKGQGKLISVRDVAAYVRKDWNPSRIPELPWSTFALPRTKPTSCPTV